MFLFFGGGRGCGGENEFTAIRNVFNEMYARDTSKKIRRTSNDNPTLRLHERPRRQRRVDYRRECGDKMYQCRASNFTEEQKCFICSTHRKGKDLGTTHSICNVILHEIVLKNWREGIQYVIQHKAEFTQEAADHSLHKRDAEFTRKRDTLDKAERRIAELEQANLKSMAEVLSKDLKQQERQKRQKHI